MADQQGQSLQGLVAEAVRESTNLAQKEFALFRTEVSENLKAMLMGVAMLVVAAVFAIAAILLFTEALVEWLATVVGSEALAALMRRRVASSGAHSSRISSSRGRASI